jgi:hypothetical protein
MAKTLEELIPATFDLPEDKLDELVQIYRNNRDACDQSIKAAQETLEANLQQRTYWEGALQSILALQGHLQLTKAAQAEENAEGNTNGVEPAEEEIVPEPGDPPKRRR